MGDSGGGGRLSVLESVDLLDCRVVCCRSVVVSYCRNTTNRNLS